MSIWFFEIYTKQPKTLECGWEIEVGSVRNASDRASAIDKLRRHYGRLFDCVIQCYAVNKLRWSKGVDPVHLDASV